MSLRSRLLPALCLALLFTLPACDSDDPGDGPNDASLTEAQANPGTWFFIETPGAECRDGSATGFGVRLQEGATNLMIYLEGGGACFSTGTCASNRASFGSADFDGFVAQGGNAGVFSTESANPVGDWNMVYVPYCTGDVHGGRAPAAVVPNVSGLQQFVGHRNVERYLDVLAPALDPGKVLLAGSSAGGFGTLLNFEQVADAFDGASPYLLDDSGPIFFADDVFSPGLGGGLAGLYNFRAALPDADALFEADGLQGIYAYYDTRYPNASFGLSSYTGDQTIRTFFGVGQPDQTITTEEYAAGLLDIRATVPDSWGTYYVSGEEHTFLRFPDRYFGSVAGTAYTEWLTQLLNNSPTDVGPATP